jgi:hypothetical protein
MSAKLIRHNKAIDENGNIIEIKIWSVPKSIDRPFGYKYSLVYIIDGRRIIGYDNSEGKGDHRHYRDITEYYVFKDIDTLFDDFHKDIKEVIKSED